MNGTNLASDDLERFKSVLLNEYQAKDSSIDQIEQTQLMTYFSSLFLIYDEKNTEILTEMCRYLNSHISCSLPSSNP